MKTLRNYVAGLDAEVPFCEGNRPYINLDNAASTPPFISVMEAIESYAPWYSSVHRGNGLKSRFSTQLYEESREIIGHFVGANESEHTVILGKNTTEAINKLSYRLQLSKKDIVIISHLEHHSNDLPWRTKATVKRIAMRTDGSIDTDHYMSLLEKYRSRIKLVAITGASNVTGHLPDIHWFAQKAHEIGAQIFVDGAQLIPHRAVDIGRLDEPTHIDYIAFSAHKMYAPFGTGALVGRKDTFLRGEPEYSGGGTIDVVTTKSVDWAALPDKDEAGSPNVIGAVALAQAIKTIEHIGMEAIAKHEAQLTKYALSKLKNIPEITVFGDKDISEAAHRLGVIPFVVKDTPSHLVAAILGHEWGIGVRSGCFCAHPYVMSLLGKKARDEQELRRRVLHHRKDLVPGMVRMSFGLYNNTNEIDAIIEALQRIIQGKHDDYECDKRTGEFHSLKTTGTISPFSFR